MDHRVWGPFDFVIDPQAFEKFLIAGENFSQGRDKQGFSKAAGTGKKIIFPTLGEKIVNLFGFIDIEIVLRYHIAEGLDTDG